jgi:phospholipid transport system substrate-binding protein
MIGHEVKLTRRGSLLALGGAAAVLAGTTPFRAVHAQVAATPTAPIQQLDQALLASMRAGNAPFSQRYASLAPVIEQVFDLDGILARSVGPAWAAMPAEQKAGLAAAFRRYTVSSYLANFNSYNGQNFQVPPDTRPAGPGQVVVRSVLSQPGESPVELDYVLAQTPRGSRVVDVLMNGTISRVAVQRSDFRQLLNSGGVPALTASLEHKVANLSGGMLAAN